MRTGSILSESTGKSGNVYQVLTLKRLKL